MSLDPGVPDDFVRWASAEATPNAFLPRTLFGHYVESRLARAVSESRGTLRIVRGEAAGVSDAGVILSDGTCHAGDVRVIAVGLSRRRASSGAPRNPSIVDAWDEEAMRQLPRRGSLLLLGTGLTSLDVLARLAAAQFSGTVTLVSRHGLLPRPHLTMSHPSVAVSAELLADLPRDLRSLLRWGRRVVREATARGEPWQSAIDGMRPHLSALWRRLSAKDRARFVRRVRPYWDVLRHRAPDDLLRLASAWRESGRLAVVRGTLSSEQSRPTSYDAIVSCLGPSIERPERESPLLLDLIHRGRAAVDEAGLGIMTDEAGHVVRPDGEPDLALFAMGALRRASSWETTSVRDIAVHAMAMAKLIVGDG